MNANQKENLKKFITGQEMSVPGHAMCSMWTHLCDVCGKASLYPEIIGTDESVQLYKTIFETIYKKERDLVVICASCVSELKKEHFRRSYYDNIFNS